jgi:hypothetical protein
MRIISRFRDYYDSARAWGADPKLVYVRHTETAKKYREDDPRGLRQILKPVMDNWDSVPGLGWQSRYDSGSLQAFLIGFCGQAYVRFKYTPPEPDMYEHEDEVVDPPRFFNTPEEVFAFSEERVAQKKDAPLGDEAIKNLREEGPTRGWGRHRYSFNDEGLELWKQEKCPVLPDEIFRELKAPVFLIHGNMNTVVLNPRLVDWGFPQVLDAYTCFQELAQYMGNNMAVQMDGMDNISDADRASMHGFGHKYAFRKEPTKKGRK